MTGPAGMPGSIDVDPDLTELMSTEQQQAIAAALAELLQHGYGELGLVVDHGRLRRLRTTTSQLLPRPGGRGKGD
jgi:hypothetical protein